MVALTFSGGLFVLIIGAEILVRGATRLAARLGVSPLIIGLTVVAFGTSSPELAVSIKAALSGQTQVALGNVVGSNIFNVLFILGLSALITPLVVAQQLIKLDVPIMIGLSLLLLVLGWDLRISRLDGLLLFSGLVVYIWFSVRHSRKETQIIKQQYASEFAMPVSGPGSNWLTQSAMIIAGLILLMTGSAWLVESATAIAKYLGVSDLIIGLTIIAAGTSLPEVVTSVIASIRGERDIAVGNIIGSNLFNIMAVLGLSSASATDGIAIPASAIRFDIPVMIAVAFACFPIFFSGGRISRWEGGLLLAYYFAYTLYLFMAATEHDALPLFSASMLYFVIPITVITLTVVALSSLRRRP